VQNGKKCPHRRFHVMPDSIRHPVFANLWILNQVQDDKQRIFRTLFSGKKPFDSIMHNGLNNCNSPKAPNPLLFRPARAVDDFFLSL
jgi:hypothetical protein